MVPCPHCGHAFASMPKRKRKCPGCGKSVFPRVDPRDDIRKLVDEVTADSFEGMWETRSRRKAWVGRLDRLGVTDASFVATVGAVTREELQAWGTPEDAAAHRFLRHYADGSHVGDDGVWRELARFYKDRGHIAEFLSCRRYAKRIRLERAANSARQLDRLVVARVWGRRDMEVCKACAALHKETAPPASILAMTWMPMDRCDFPENPCDVDWHPYFED